MRNLALRAFLLGTTAVAGWVPPAIAADGTVGAAGHSPVAAEEEIVVTARKRGESLMNVPVVVSVQTAETLERNNAVSLAAIGELTPSVIVGDYRGQGGGTIAIRGISSPANQTGFEQAVSVAIDGVQTSNGRVAQLGFFDLQQVEVLKGPQALFFGKNNTAGVISVKSAGPTDTFQAKLRTSYEFEADEVTTEGIVSGPLTDKLRGRIAFRYRNMDGWMRNTAGPLANPFNTAIGAPASNNVLPGARDHRPGDEEFLGRVTLEYKPTPSFTATARVLGSHSTDDGPGVATQNIGPCTGAFPRTSGQPDPYGDCKVDNRTTVGDVDPALARTMTGANADGTPSGVFDALLGSLTLNADLGQLNLASVTGYDRVEYDAFSGLDQTTYSQLAQFEGQKQSELSQELRLSSSFDFPVNFMFGLFYQNSKIDLHHDTKLGDGNYKVAVNRWSSFDTIAKQDGESYSAFGQLTYKVIETLEFAAGLRWSRENKDYHKFNLYGIGAFNTAAQIYPGSNDRGVLRGKFTDENLSPEFTLTWRPTNDITVFGAYRTGFKSGGFGLTNPLTTATRIASVDYGSETAEGFEFGARGNFMGGRLRLSADVFHYKFSNLQVNIYDPSTISYSINNAGKVTQNGFEFEGEYHADDNLMLHGAMALVRNEFGNFTGQCYGYNIPAGTPVGSVAPPPNCSFIPGTNTLQQVFDGRAPARSPEWTANAGFVYQRPIDQLRFEFTGDAFYSDSYFAAETLVASSRQDAFWKVKSSVSLGDLDDRWKVYCIGRNLSNEYILLYAADRTGGASIPFAIGEQRGVVGRGRELVLQVQLAF